MEDQRVVSFFNLKKFTRRFLLRLNLRKLKFSRRQAREWLDNFHACPKVIKARYYQLFYETLESIIFEFITFARSADSINPRPKE